MTEEIPAFDEVETLRAEAHDLSAEMVAAATALAESGIAPSLTLLERANKYAERLQSVAGPDAPADLTLAGLSQILRSRRGVRVTAQKLDALSRLSAAALGYEEALMRVRDAASAVVPGQGNDEQEAALLWLHDAVAGEIAVTPAEFPAVRDRLVAAGLDERVAVALVAGQLRYSDDAPAVGTRVAEQAMPGTEEVVVPQKPSGYDSTPHGTQRDRLIGATPTQLEPAAPDGGVISPHAPASTDGVGDETQATESEPIDSSPPESPGDHEEDVQASTGGRGSTAGGVQETPRTDRDQVVEASGVIARVAGDSVELGEEAEEEPEPEASEESATEPWMAAAVQQGDLSLAYWLARGLQAQGKLPSMAPTAIACSLFASHATGSDEPFGAAFEEQALETLAATPARAAAALVACAGALRAAIVLPYGSAPLILGELAPRFDDSLGELLALIAERAPRGDLLQPARAAAAARAEASRESAISEIIAAAAERIDRASKETHKYVPAVAVWRQLVARNGPLGRLLTAIASGAPDATSRETLEHFGDVKAVNKEIDQLFNQARTHPGRIEAGAREWLWRHINEVVELGRNWVAVHDMEESATPGAQAAGDDHWLRRKLRELSASVDEQVDTMSCADDAVDAAAARLMRLSWCQLKSYVIEGESIAVDVLAETPAEALGESLARALDLAIRSDFTLSEDELDSAEPALIRALSTTWEDAFEARMEESAYHLARVCVGHLPPERRQASEERRAERLAAARRGLEVKTEDTRRRLDAALREQLIADTAYAAKLQWLQAIDRDTQDVASVTLALLALDSEIDTAREAYAHELREKLEALQPSPDARAHIESLLDARELAVATEYLARLEAGEVMVERPERLRLAAVIAAASALANSVSPGRAPSWSGSVSPS